MNPFEGQRRLEVRAEQVVWHLVSAGVLGLLLLALVVSVTLLDGASGAPAEADPVTPRVARPIEDEAKASVETSHRCAPVVPVAVPGQEGLPLPGRRVEPADLVAEPRAALDA